MNNKNINLNEKLLESFREYSCFKKESVAYSSLVELSCIYHVLNYLGSLKISYELWAKKLEAENFDDTFIKLSNKEMFLNYTYTIRIVSIGDYWNDDEWVLILLYRLNFEMLKDFFKFKNLEFPELPLHDLCNEMKALSQTKKNKKSFALALSQMKKNSPLPFVDIWFEADYWDPIKRKLDCPKNS